MKPFAELLLELIPDIYAEYDTAGDLKAFLSVIGPALDELKSHIDDIPDLASPGDCPPDFLGYLAALVETEFDPKASPTPQRQRIQEAIERYRRTGTTSALARELARQGWCGEIVETYHSVLRLNYRSKLNHQKLPGRKYNHGIYGIMEPLDDREFLDIAASHQPVGTICWIGEESQS
ncbi:MAG: phage tail protein [Armatimonadota bacterium]